MVDFLVKKTPASRLNKMGTLRHDYDMDVDASRIAYGTLEKPATLFVMLCDLGINMRDQISPPSFSEMG
jgi:hypothetical protein